MQKVSVLLNDGSGKVIDLAVTCRGARPQAVVQCMTSDQLASMDNYLSDKCSLRHVSNYQYVYEMALPNNYTEFNEKFMNAPQELFEILLAAFQYQSIQKEDERDYVLIVLV